MKARIPLAFAEAGAHVVCAARSMGQIDETAVAVRERGRRAYAVECDVMQRAHRERLVAATLAEFGGIDLLVNNAGGWPPKEALRTSERAFEEAFRFNVTSAFLLRNLADLKQGLAEMKRVTRPGGRVVALEITQVTMPGFASLFRFYFHEIVPRLGRIVSGDPEAYRYLPQSVDRFLTPDELARLMGEVGLRGVRYRRLGLGTVTVHTIVPEWLCRISLREAPAPFLMAHFQRTGQAIYQPARHWRRNRQQ